MKLHFKFFLLVCTWVFCHPTLQAQQKEGFLIKGKINGIRDTTVFLAHYFGYNQQVIKDTALVDAQGNFVFQGNKSLPQGLYLVSLPKGKYLDVVIAEQHFGFETDTSNFVKHIKITGSKENELFFSFQQQMAQRITQLKSLDAQARTQNASAAQALKKAQDELKQFQQTWLTQHQQTLVAKIIKASQEPDIPAYPKPVRTKADSAALYQFQFNYYKNHFWDNFDLSDERLIRTPFLQKKLERYFEDLTMQQSDSIALEADKLLAKAKAKDLRKYIIYKISSTYENPKILGTDGAFVHMAEKYYIGEPALWDTSTVRRMGERIAILKNILIGKPFPTIYLTDTLGKEIDIKQIPADYTIVFLYDPECSHCRESAPKLKQIAGNLATKNVKVLAASIDRDAEKWKKFIKEFGFQSFVNGIDIHKNPQSGKPEYYTDFLKVFDVYATPVIYVLNKNKQIIAKRLAIEQVEDFIDFYSRKAK